MLSMWAATVGRPATVVAETGDLLGHPAHTFAEWVADHAAAFAA